MELPKNLVLVIFGATGDLANKKLIPAIYSLYIHNFLPELFAVVGVGRTEMTSTDFHKEIEDGIRSFSREKELSNEQINAFTGRLSYLSFDVTSVTDYSRLKVFLDKICEKCMISRNFLFYLAISPDYYEVAATNLALEGFNDQTDGFRRLIIEKPFGYDLESCLKLNNKLHELYKEEQLYRIDHYLGKETVQNLLVTRFANGMFEPLWNRNYVQRIEITSAEDIGIENRGRYYDSAGALRDMVQNHLLQMVGLTAMEPPSSFDSDAIRNEMLKVFQSLKPIKEEDVDKQVIRGQYISSKIRGKSVTGYREEKYVAPGSRTETYVAIKFFIDNWRWGGVPFYIRTGKRLPTRVTEIIIYFKPTPHHLFRNDSRNGTGNQLIIRIQPDEGILLKFGMKEPGTGFVVRNVSMDFHYKDLSDVHVPEAYERLLHDAMLGDSTLYSRDDVVETAWKFLGPIQKAWANNPEIKLNGYPAGTWGPENADGIFEEPGQTWRYPCKNLSNDDLYCEL
jgi:glucose-6-phosphate 1-dehydrogenase